LRAAAADKPKLSMAHLLSLVEHHDPDGSVFVLQNGLARIARETGQKELAIAADFFNKERYEAYEILEQHPGFKVTGETVYKGIQASEYLRAQLEHALRHGSVLPLAHPISGTVDPGQSYILRDNYNLEVVIRNADLLTAHHFNEFGQSEAVITTPCLEIVDKQNAEKRSERTGRNEPYTRYLAEPMKDGDR
jgi:hypothetical protein